MVISAMNFTTAILAHFALKPMRRRWFDRTNQSDPILLDGGYQGA
jgi:hypothetical protein